MCPQPMTIDSVRISKGRLNYATHKTTTKSQWLNKPRAHLLLIYMSHMCESGSSAPQSS